ncbi:hypothetical protein [Pinibacter soli]|uniref:Uncharacterized protein n=1 Tax=Pinibacter soli TaxID=3044211 RepID=A0ABT6RFV6_9BACT|nr:hypothetical protein [Pinibacter soli]MDI3321430.1 hypothetical protein [Pinibacter soli]
MHIKKTLILILTILFFEQVYAQKIESQNFYDEIKNYDVSRVITADSITVEEVENAKVKLAKAEPFGFIGDDCQRFYIHFISVIQNPNNHYEYFVYGKTKVKEIVRPFQGTLVVEKAIIAKKNDHEQGIATCEVNLFEDIKMTSTGFIKGTMTVGFVIDSEKNFKYDALLFYTDGFSNNEFKGTWRSYKTNTVKKCNWGDYRIPESGDLDIGAGEFSPNSKYFDKGWNYYILSLSGDTEIDVELGRKNEKIKWWK